MHTHSRLFKIIAQLLIAVMCGQPLLSAAADLRVDTRAGAHTKISQAGNGVPVVNIAKPSDKGLSHNKFIDYNVGQQGLILNNSTDKFTQTQLGGVIIGNNNLNGKSAQLILNEVTGGQASQLKGYTEVAGKQAHVVVANPHGITCDGCGFINTPHATLTTGKPIIEQGQLKRYDVEAGQIEISGAGLNATNISQFDLITRSAKINAELHANELNIITGRNSVDAQTLAATAKTDHSTDKPNFAIDSSALGGMYAGAIRLVGTEAGVGVKLAGDMAASAGDIRIDANGKLSLARVSAKQQITANGQEVELTEQVYAGDAIKVTADTLTNKNNLLAANAIELTAKNVDNQGLIEAGLRADNTLNNTADVRIQSTELNNSGSVIAGRNLQIDGKEKVTNRAGRLVGNTGLALTTKKLDNQQGLITATGTVAVSAQQIDNRQQGEISSQQQLTVKADQLDNREQGRVISEADLSIAAQKVDNRQSGIIVAEKNLALAAASIDNSEQGLIKGTQVLAVSVGDLNNQNGGRVLSNAALNLQAQQLNNSGGALDTQGQLNIAAESIDNASGHIVGDAGVQIRSDRLDNQAGGLILSHGQLDATVDRLNNQQGSLIADAGVSLKGQTLNNAAGRISSQNSVQLDHIELINSQGLIVAGNDLSVAATTVENAQGELSAGHSLVLDAQLLQQKQGQILSAGTMSLSAQTLDNSGQGLISAATELTIQTDEFNNQEQGTVLSDGVLNIQTKQLNNANKGLLASKGLLQIQTHQLDQHNQGELISEKAIQLNLSGGDLNNSQGGLIYAPQLQLQLQQVGLLNNSQGGEISSQKGSVLHLGKLNNQGGKLISEGTLELTQTAQVLDNRGGLIHAANDLTFNNLRALDNSQAGEISSEKSVQLTLENLNNSQGGVIVSSEQLEVAAQHIDNQHKGLLSGLTALHVTADRLENQNLSTLSSRNGELTVNVAGQVNNSQQGALVSQQALNVKAGSLVNQQGVISSEANVELQVVGDLDNRSGDIAGQNVTLNSDNLDNTAGQVSAEDTLAITLVNQLLNQHNASLISGQELLLTASILGNQNSTIASEGLLSIFAQQLRNEQQATLAANEQLQINAQQLTNQSGRIISEQGAVSIQARTVDNRDGVIASLLDRLTLSFRGLFNNQSGTAQGQIVAVQAHEIDNQAGYLAATATDLELSAAAINNQGGGLYAQQHLIVTGRQLDNSNQGQIAANSVDFSLSGTLNNQSGLIEANHLDVLVDSINNSQGQLRALAAAENSVIRTAATLDNRSGSIEVANTDFVLDTPNLLNQSGSIVHAGRGQFDLMSGHARHVGGTLISQGSLSVTSDSWENSTLFQAGTLTFNVEDFKQTATGQLIASQSLNATGNTWINDGLIASDGSLNLNLTDSYSGNGQVVSLGDMQLSAQQFILGQPAIIYTEGAGRIENQSISNLGYISAGESLIIDTQRLHNRGTLGSAQQLTINASDLANEHGLLFSGADMLLRVNQFTNRYADVYSLGNIDLAGYGTNAQAQRVDNISANMEAEGDFSLRSAVVENRRDVLEIEESGKYSVVINELACRGPYNPNGDCKLGSNGRKVGVWQINEREKLEVTASSTASSLKAGSDFSLLGGKLFNSSSQISSGGDLMLSLSELTNIGVKPADFEVQRVFVSGRKPSYYYYLGLKNNFNAKHVPQVQVSSVEQDLSYFIGRMEREYLPSRKIIGTPLAGEEYSAIIQAGGDITIHAEQTLDNSVIRPSYNYVGGGSRVDTRAPGSAHATQVSINSQLPSDLQQKQIDPTVLPGFDVPMGNKGLFRLSDQAAQDRHAQAAESAQTPVGNGSARGDQLAQHGSQSSGQDALLSSLLGNNPHTLETFGKSQAQLVMANVQNLQGQNNSHRYLIETNPALTNMRQFLSSDYLFNGLGLQSGQMQKRLGDGLYEQRLLRESIVARTGQRFIAGLTSDEAMFRYLMDNAIASKDALSLSVGISLSAEQVAALTHDIVWMEEREVLGEKVLTPVLYLAQTEGRLAPSGALIQGGDLTLVSGGDLNNQGTLRASNNLSAQAQTIHNSGLIHAGERLSLLAENSIYNRQGGILAGRDVDLTARTGDILNERTVTRHASALGNSRWESSFADSAARIDATRDLTLQAGRDVHNLGGVLESRGDLQVSAGRDVTLAAVEERHGNSRGSHYINSQTTQLSSETRADGNLNIQAGRDLTAIASRVQSGKDMQLIAGNDLKLVSAANESHHYSKSKKRTSQRDQVRQVDTEVNSGGQFTAVAGQDLTLVSSSVVANDEAYLVAGGKVQLLAAQDYDYSFSEKKKKGSFGRKNYRMSESDNSTAVVSSIQAGIDLLMHGAEAIVSQGAQLQAEHHLELQSDGDILLLAAENNNRHASAKSKSGLLSSKGKTSSQSQTQIVGTTVDAGSILIVAGQDLRVNAGDLRAQGDMALQAERDVELSSAMQYSSQSQSKHSSKLGFSHHALLTHTQKQQAAEQGSGTAVGSYLSADNLLIKGGRDTRIQGSTLISERDMHIRAGRDLDIVSAENTSHSSTSSSSKKTGEIGSWWQPAIGQVKQKVKTQGETLQQSGSQLASLTGNIHLQAGETYQQTASGVLALEGDIHIQGKQVNIEAGYDQLSHSETRSANRTAVGGTVSIPVVNAIQSMQQVNKARERTDDPRMQTLAAATLAMQGKAAYDGAQALYNGNVGGIKISLNLSNNNSKSHSTQQGQNVSASSVIAGGDIHVQATGAQDSDLNIIGSRLSAGQDIRLQADRNILLRAAENTATQSSKENGGGWSVGVGFGLGGSQNGFTLDLAANQFRGKSDGNDSLWSNTQVEAGRRVHLESGADTRLQGAVVKGEQVTADIGGNLLLESLQDRSTYQSKHSSSSAGVSLCIPPFCAGTSTASASQSNSKARGDYASVNQQTGIQAGDGGFQLKVNGHTDLTGAVIASSEQAVQDRLNRLETGTLRARDIANHAQAKAGSSGLTVNSDMLTTGKYGIAKGVIGNEMDQGSVKDISSGHSLSAISDGEILIRDEAGQLELTGQSTEETLALLRRDTDNTHTAAERIDIRELERDAEAQRIIKQAVFAEAVKFTDETYRVMFLEEAQLYIVERDEGGKVKFDDNGYAVVRELSQDEKNSLGSDGKPVKIFNNGIFNVKEAAEGYAAQMLPGSDEQVYLIHFPKADNAVSELLVAGYQKFLENDFWGLANATLEAKDMMRLYGETGLDIAGHSRGSMTLLNAMQSLQKEGAVGSLSETMVHFFGPAANAQTAAKLLYELSGGKQDTVHLQNHKDDFVGTILGGNPATYDKVPEGSSKIKEWINMFNEQPTVHSCYGKGSDKCDTAYGQASATKIKYEKEK